MKRIIFSLIGLAFLVSCNNETHLISDKQYREDVEKRFEEKKALAENRADELFSIFDEEQLTTEETEALQFLYAFMPIADLAEYYGDFFLKNVRHSLMLRDSLSWGSEIPEEVFRHFVLPIRVNNENLDSSRWVFFDELYDRVKDLSMTDAALEVNHWCHEKVTYKGSDIRTSSPLASVKTAHGRCGEESTFTVAAMRSVGIPARQVYTPRWAHSDDNHAWVEVWVDGEWHYLGACEPEPVLDRGWFTGPALRSMLVHTRVYGNYQGTEEVVYHEDDYAVINSTATYRDVVKTEVKVLDENGKAVENARVDFRLYNYAEFYPIAKLETDAEGKCGISIGPGDILIWATDGEKSAWKKVNLRNENSIELVLQDIPQDLPTEEWLLDVPDQANAKIEKIPEDIQKAHKKRWKYEDSLRNGYRNTFPTTEAGAEFLYGLDLQGETDRVLVEASEGNYKEIMSFMESAAKTDGRNFVIPLLDVVSLKDLRDTRADYLMENIEHFTLMIEMSHYDLDSNAQLYYEFLLNPRIGNEFLRPYKMEIMKILGDEINDESPEMIFKWVSKEIKIDSTRFYSHIPITPKGVLDLRVSDPASRDLFFVAVCRSFGHAARFNQATLTPEVYIDNEWKEFSFSTNNKEKTSNASGELILEAADEKDPKYFIDFTIAKLKNGVFRTMEFVWETPLSEFEMPLKLDAGQYMIVTGKRLPNGDVLSLRQYFVINDGESKTMEVKYGDLSNVKIESVKFESNVLVKMIKGGAFDLNAQEMKGKNYLIAVINPDAEPSKHILQELSNSRKDVKKAGLEVLIMANGPIQNGVDIINTYKLGNVVKQLYYDENTYFELLQYSKLRMEALPLILFVSENGDVEFRSEGYTINSVEMILDRID